MKMKSILKILVLALLSAGYGTAKDYYIDSQLGNDDNTGTSITNSWKSLSKVNQTLFMPGDTLNFKRGCVWFGQLKPKGSGTEGKAIVVKDYGEGELPIIDGNGVIGEAVVYLHNQEYWEITNLEIVNTSDVEADRRGVWLSGSNCGVLNHLHLKGLHIHDIYGIAGQSLAAKKTGGIYIAITDDAEKPSRWNDVRIENCIIHDVRNSGITTQNETTQGIHDFPPDSNDWIPRRITNLYIGNNTIYNVSKNGIIVRLADGGLVEHNLLHHTAIGSDGKGMTGNTIFSRSSKNTVFQYNEGYANISPDFDGSLYDADLNSPGTVWQYSYSHDNAHGLFWSCTVQSDEDVVVRYNISENDMGGIITVNYPVSSMYIYNNTIYIGPHRSPIILYERGRGDGNYRNYKFFNNLVYNKSNSASFEFNDDPKEGYVRQIYNNLFFGVNPPKMSNDHIQEDPLLVCPGNGLAAVDFNDPEKLWGYKLRKGSPAIDAGILTNDNGGVDFWGSKLFEDAVDIGAHEYVKEEN